MRPTESSVAANPSLPLTVNLDDKYSLRQGTAFLTGMQALTRLPLVIRQRDAAAGLHTAGYISGYRGSPLGTYDMAMWQAKKYFVEHHIHFQPGVNEDLAATAVWGSQQVKVMGPSQFDGVFGIWYGKAPGVDRTLDVFRHANVAGTSPHGGVLVLAGDDPNAVSSTVTSYSEYNFVSTGMPLLYPATIQEYLDFGVLGIEMSRFSGCWIGFKAVTDVAESSAHVDVGLDRVTVVRPEFEFPADGVHIRWPDDRLEAEKRLMTVKLEAAKAFARANAIDAVIWDPPQARTGLVAAGKAYLDLLQALADMGVDEEVAQRLGIRLYKVGLVWPIEEQGMRQFYAGLERILVVEEKRSLLEDQIVIQLHREPNRPQVLGKRDAAGAALLPNHGETDPALLVEALVRAIPELGQLPSVQARRAVLHAQQTARAALPKLAVRSAYFCSGCPHSTSTKVPEGSLALAGIGCHWLSLFMDRQTETFTQMGGEGATWLGMMPFTDRQHVFVNLGDGTYHHSGILAIRAAVYAKAHVTYKLLFNDAVAMTGGQMVSDTYTPQEVVQQILAEGVGRAVVVSDDIEKYKSVAGGNGGFPAGVTLHHRDDLDKLQRELRDTPGVSLLLYDQTCAAEKRRRRKRGKMQDPDTRVFINEEVCEGCGDCSVQSNCISVEPLETALGRKRQINQSSCNKDISCVKGFCPSFVTLHGATPRGVKKTGKVDVHALAVALPAPVVASLARPYEIVITGIGGTGVITVGAVLGMAARLEGRGVTCLDQTGIAQKNGAVLSHVRVAARPQELFSMRVAAAKADLVLGCDLMVAASPAALATMAAGRTTVLVNTHLAPNASFVLRPVTAEFGEDALLQGLVASVGDDAVLHVEASRIALALFGDTIAANMFMLGYAIQRGLIPVSLAAVERAVEINGAAVDSNREALAWGRVAAVSPDQVTRQSGFENNVIALPVSRKSQSLEEVVRDRRARLVMYQNEAYAKRYEALVEAVRAAEGQRVPGAKGKLAIAVARYAYKLMAYKDEYEVARLYTDGAFQRRLEQAFEGDVKIRLHLAPPLLARRDPATGHLKKQSFGPWVLTAFKLLARMKGLRGTPLDVFGWTRERRDERALVAEYFAGIGEMTQELTPDNHAVGVELASLPERIRGYGHVKEGSVQQARTEGQRLMKLLRAPILRCKQA